MHFYLNASIHVAGIVVELEGQLQKKNSRLINSSVLRNCKPEEQSRDFYLQGFRRGRNWVERYLWLCVLKIVEKIKL